MMNECDGHHFDSPVKELLKTQSQKLLIDALVMDWFKILIPP